MWQDPPNYFDDIVYPSYEKYNQFALGSSGFVKIDSHANKIEDVIVIALREILAVLNNK